MGLFALSIAPHATNELKEYPSQTKAEKEERLDTERLNTQENYHFMSDPATIKKTLSAQFSVEVPPPLEHTDPEALSALLLQGNDVSNGLTVIDVRLAEEYAAGHIKGSINIPHSEFDAKAVVEKIAALRLANGAHKVIFASLQSPDVDEAVAQEFIQQWEEATTVTTSADAATSASPSTFVSLLLGGIFYWLRLYRTQPELTESYNDAVWGELLSKHEE